MGRGDGPFLFLVLFIYTWIPAADALPPPAKCPLTGALNSWLKTTSSFSCLGLQTSEWALTPPFLQLLSLRHQKILLALHTETVKHLTPPHQPAGPSLVETVTISHLDHCSAFCLVPSFSPGPYHSYNSNQREFVTIKVTPYHFSLKNYTMLPIHSQ